MPLPPWTVELLRHRLVDAAKRAAQPETLQKIKSQATELLNELPETAARGLDRVMRTTEAGKESVRRWSRKHTTLAIPIINATGTLIHQQGLGVGASDDAIAAAIDVLRGDTVGGQAFNERIERRLERLVSAEQRIAIASSLPAALSSLAMLMDEHTLVVHRSCAVRMPNGQSLAEAVPLVTEVGSVDEVRSEDFANLNSPCAIQADVGSAMLVPMPVEGIQVAVLPLATLDQLDVDGLSNPIPSALAVLQNGFDIVIMGSDLLAGGSQSGWIVGRRNLIDAMTHSGSWETISASPAIQAMSLVAIESSRTNAAAAPVLASLLTSIENLKGRAERLALRFSASPSVESCKVSDEPARLTETGRWTLPSRQVRVRLKGTSPETLAAKLRNSCPALWVQSHEEELIIDMRWVQPERDAEIVLDSI